MISGVCADDFLHHHPPFPHPSLPHQDEVDHPTLRHLLGAMGAPAEGEEETPLEDTGDSRNGIAGLAGDLVVLFIFDFWKVWGSAQLLPRTFSVLRR